MELPNSKTQKKYKEEIKKIETELKEASKDGVKEKQLEKIHRRLDNLAQKLEEIEREVRVKEAERQTYFFYRSPLAVALLTFFTGGFYTIYWFYRHWRAIEESSGKKTHPILSAIFQVFTIYPLLKYIKEGAQQAGYREFTQIKAAAISYIALSAFSALLGLPFLAQQGTAVVIASLVVGLCYALILATAQKAANARNVAFFGKKHKFKHFYLGEVIMTIVGVVLSILSILLTTGVIDNPDLTAEPPRVKEQRVIVERLEKQFNDCSKSLEAEDATLDESSEVALSTYASHYEACEKIRLKLNAEADEYDRRSSRY